MINWFRGYYRLILAGIALGLGGPFVTIAAALPIKPKGLPLAMWALKALVTLILVLLNIKVSSPQPEKLQQHQGFVFPNHISYLDILALLRIAPMRFLARDGVRKWPVVGMIATAVQCVFVNRDDKQSRGEARSLLTQVDRFPPIALFPEGKRGTGYELLPFRYGAFEIVLQGEIPFLPCAIVYQPLEIGIWRRSEHFFKALWRLARYPGPLQIQVIPLDIIQPTAEMDVVKLSTVVREQITAVLSGKNGFLP